jgi:hypothetical protein
VTPEELREEIAVELQAIEATVAELMALSRDLTDRSPTVREKTAAAAFLAQFYGGVENILKRICAYHSVPLPTGDTWHVELFQRFSSPGHPPLPVLFDRSLAADLAPYRRFRHVVFHSYGFQLDWTRMTEGMANVEAVFLRMKARLDDYLRSVSSDG